MYAFYCTVLHGCIYAAWLYLCSAGRKLLPSSFFHFCSGQPFSFIQAKCKINACFSLLDLGNNGVLNVIKLGITLKQGHNYCRLRCHVIQIAVCS